MVSLCLTKPRIDGRVTDTSDYIDKGKSNRTKKERQKFQVLTARNETVTAKTKKQKKDGFVNVELEPVTLTDLSRHNSQTESSTRTSSQQEQDLFRSGTDTVTLKALNELNRIVSKTENRKAGDKQEDLKEHRYKMLSTLRTMGDPQGKRELSRKQKRSFLKYKQQMPDATVDKYQVHKWRLKSGRNTISDKLPERTIIQMQRKIKTMKEFQKLNFKQGSLNSTFSSQNVESRYLSKKEEKTSMLQGKEHLFGISHNDDAETRTSRKRSNWLPRLRNRLYFRESLPLLWEDPEDPEDENNRSQSNLYSESRGTELSLNFDSMMTAQSNVAKNQNETRRASETQVNRHQVLPPINPIRRRQSFPTKRLYHSNEYKLNQSLGKRRISLNPSSSSMPIPENKILPPPINQGHRKTTSIDANLKRYENAEDDVSEAKVLGGSPIHKKSSYSSRTMHSTGSVRSPSKEGKEGDTPTDSEGSYGGAKLRHSNKKRGSKILTKMDTRISPQAFRYSRPPRTDFLMRQWYIYARLSIWLSRLFKSHRITVDDSYNIHHGSYESGDDNNSQQKKEVLFDVTDYKMKNQLRLSDTTRKVLLTPSEKRTDKDINLVQTALRNIKAVSDYSNSVQQQIGKLGYFVGFEGKRVVVNENKRPFNYYLLLAGSAVVIKSDESGNTNPVLFMKRGDIFGESEILDDTRWQWSVATSGYCEFLLLDREDYKRIFITGGGGGLLSDPDRGGFIRSINILQQWPINLLGENPNRCLFRYFKRGAVLVKDSTNSEWIYVVKSGSCSVLKQLQVESLTDSEALYRLKKQQKFRSEFSANPRLVEKADQIEKEDHVNLLLQKEEEERNKEVSVYQQLEMSSILKELNPDVIGTTTSPRAEAGFDDRRSEFPLPSYNAETIRGMDKKTFKGHEKTVESQVIQEENEDSFRLSRHSDRHPPRTPSPTKAAYLRTGISTRSAKRIKEEENRESTKNEAPPEIVVTEERDKEKPRKILVSPQKQVHINEYLFGSQTPEQVYDEAETNKVAQPIHINVRRLTKRDVFGIEAHLYSNQPSLALVSNGAECLMLNKKFFLENAKEDCIKFLKETGYPYPSDAELEEEHWRLVTWKAYQAKVLQEALSQMSN